MNLLSHGPGCRGSVAAIAVAILGCMSVPLLAAAAPPVAAAPAAVLTPDQIAKLLEEGTGVLKQGNPELALKNYFEPVNQSFMRQTAKAGADDEIYASHSATETAAYAGKVAKENEGAKTPLHLVIVDGTWTDALVLKARAQVELKRIDQAKSTLNQATILSPAYPSVWLEMASIYQGEKNWEKALGTYKTAANYAGAIEEKALQTQMLTAGLRGQAAALIELTRLDEAEALYQRCVKLNPGDTAATDGLAKISALRGPGAATPATPTANPATAKPAAPTSH